MGRSWVACLNFSANILAQKQGTRAVKTAVTAISRGLLCEGHCGPSSFPGVGVNVRPPALSLS
jgi:hypothetical protein